MSGNVEEPLVPLSSDEYGQSGGDSDEDVITDYLAAAAVDMLPRPGVPTISVTPHSPAAKQYPVLEDTLQQLRELQESVQRMRDLPPHASPKDCAAFVLNPLALRLAQVARLSASCPILNEPGLELDLLGSVGSSPLHQPTSRKDSGAQDWLLCQGLQGDTTRRRSWTALEDLSGTKDKIKHSRQRSMSLSSMESEADESSLLDTVDGSTVRLLGADPAIVVARRGHRGSGGAASTHSLNEADLQNDFNKLKAKREAEQLRLLPARLPLQKSVSTPSIIAVRDIAQESGLSGAQPTLPMGRPSGTESETEEEGRNHPHYDIPTAHLLHHVVYDHSSEKRRKRGSLFFRKKKDKSKKITHQWVSACYGSSHICDWCSKPLSNKPALYCENCTTTVHQNTCKDNIVDCTKPKGAKNASKISGFAVPLTNSKNSVPKRGSASAPSSQNSSSNRRSQLCYSPWRRVATKLGVNQIINEDKETDPHHHSHHDNTNFADDVPIVPLEFLSDTPLTAADLCLDPILGLHETEPDSWTPHVGKEIARKFKEKEVKRQEHIYEFILTEKHHCMTLLVMQKIFVEGLQKYFQLGPNLERMFPRLMDLTELHLELLSRLRQRQREAPVVTSIADILLEQFSSGYAVRLKSAYGEFCSRQADAVEIYKYYLQNDSRFGQFVRHCQTNPLLKKKGIPECILFVTQRLTKYPLLIEPLIKTSKENRQEQEALQKALALVKEILVEVDAQVAEKEKEGRKLQIYNRIDAKSYTVHREHKFKKSDILQGNRALRFEGVAMLMQGRGKMQVVLVIVLSDVLFFLQENSHKYSFFTPDNKAGVVSLQKLLVREKAGQESRGIYLISSNPADPEMFELKVHKPKDKQIWIQAIRNAVQSCPEDEEDSIALTSEEKQKLLNAKQSQIRHLVGLLRQKDVEQALLLEEKMALQLRLLAAAGLDPPSPPSYRHLVSETADTNQMWKEAITAVQEVSQLASSLYTSGTNLSRSVSSAGEHQSDAYVSPTLPKRAETFGGFDNPIQGPLKLLGKKLYSTASATPAGSPDSESQTGGGAGASGKLADTQRLFERLPWRNCVLSAVPPTALLNGGAAAQATSAGAVDAAGNPLGVSGADIPALLSLGREQQLAAVQLSHYLFTLLCIISQLITSNESLQVQIAAGKGTGADGSKQYRHNQQLEELRNLQDKLSVEKSAWTTTREQESKELEEKRQELVRLQEQVRVEQADITQQREQLYRKMEVLSSQGLLISPSVAIPVNAALDESPNHSADHHGDNHHSSSNQSDVSPTPSTLSHTTSDRRKADIAKWSKGATGATKSQLPLNLISTTNQQKVSQNIPIKQQLPLKLASRLSSGGSGGVGGSSQQQQQSNAQQQSQSQSGPQQMLPLKLSQDERARRTSGTGYQRLADNFASPTQQQPQPAAACVPAAGEPGAPMASHSRTGSSPAMMQASPPGAAPASSQSTGAKAARTNTYPKFPDKYKVRNQEQATPDEEVIYF